ncbi:MAG TPA: DNA cytosine methyltransferase, partial [Cyclobacteriaceae bacterium]|nr:DNA cytosine methyltransferase [Cyclobacteriaceae bacterium]
AQIVAAFDMWEPAIVTYNANFGEGEAQQIDIFDLDPHKVADDFGDIDLVLASPECTNHSKAKGKGIRCERSRETALEVIRFAEVLKPKWIVIENVMEMLQWSRHDELKQSLEALDYNCVEKELDAQHFNVPQSRKRLFMLCSRVSDPKQIDFTKSKSHLVPARKIISSNRYEMRPLRTARRAIATLAKADYAIQQMQEEGKELEPFLVVYYGSAKKGGNGGWQNLDRPLRTVTTLDRFGYVIPGQTRDQDEMRMLQPDELKRAMGYGDDFVFAEGLARRDKVKLMGNGVCPPVMEAILKSLINQERN